MSQYYPNAYGTDEKRKALHAQTFPTSVDPQKEVARRQKDYTDALTAPESLTLEKVLEVLHYEGALLGNLNFAEIPNAAELVRITAAGFTVTNTTQDISEFNSNFTGIITTGCVIEL
jgi:hypothetical protein